MTSNTVIFVAARDSYSETWDAFFSLFFKYWPDCPYPVYLFTEEKIFPDPRVTPLVIENDPTQSWGKQWGDRMDKALSRIGADYFILLHTDYFFIKKIDTARIIKLSRLLQQDNIGYIRLCPVPPPKITYAEDMKLGIISKKDAYAVSLQAAFWKRKIFDFFLVRGLNPGEFEVEGSKNSYKIKELFLSAKKKYPALPYVHGISKNVWQYDAVRFLKREGLNAESTRKVESLVSYLSRILYINMLKYRIKLILNRIHFTVFI